MRSQIWLVAALLLAAVGCGASKTVEPPTDPLLELKAKTASGPPLALMKKK